MKDYVKSMVEECLQKTGGKSAMSWTENQFKVDEISNQSAQEKGNIPHICNEGIFV